MLERVRQTTRLASFRSTWKWLLGELDRLRSMTHSAWSSGTIASFPNGIQRGHRVAHCRNSPVHRRSGRWYVIATSRSNWPTCMPVPSHRGPGGSELPNSIKDDTMNSPVAREPLTVERMRRIAAIKEPALRNVQMTQVDGEHRTASSWIDRSPQFNPVSSSRVACRRQPEFVIEWGMRQCYVGSDSRTRSEPHSAEILLS